MERKLMCLKVRYYKTFFYCKKISRHYIGFLRGVCMCIYEKNKTCCFIGHRKIHKTHRLIDDLHTTILDLIVNKGVCIFLFGSRSEFDDLGLEVVSELKKEYPHIRRVYVRAEYPYIDDDYKAYLLESYEDTYYPKHIENSGKSAYVERNIEMINNSDYCIFYYDATYKPQRIRKSSRDLTDYQPKSGTRIAYKYALEENKSVLNMYKQNT